jgi:small subunit ribosomal protein S4e
MSKKGGSNHFVRMRASKYTGVVGRKKIKWLLAPEPGTHKKEESISTGVLLRDVLAKASSIHEVKRILNSGAFTVDGKKITEAKFPIGIMDIISLPIEKKAYRMSLSGPRLVPREIKAEDAARKYLKVVGKSVVKKGKISIAFHDGRNFLADKHINTGDTCVFSVPEFKLISHIKLAPGVQCLVMKGKHMGEVAKLDKIIERPGSHDTEALLTGPAGEFVIVVKYLFAIDENY